MARVQPSKAGERGLRPFLAQNDYEGGRVLWSVSLKRTGLVKRLTHDISASACEHKSRENTAVDDILARMQHVVGRGEGLDVTQTRISHHVKASN